MERKNTIKKNKEGYGYTYTDITAINNYCMENGITYYQEVETCEINGKDYIITYLTENEETKRYRGCEIVQATLQGIKNPVQEYGSSLTYCRRYSLLMALGLATEDNDAQDLTISTSLIRGNWGSYVGMSCDKFDYGDIVEVKGNFSKVNKATNEYCFDYREFLKQKKIDGNIMASKVNLLRKNSMLCKISKVKIKLNKYIDENYSDTASGFLKTLLLGETNES